MATHPRITSSLKRITYRPSSWRLNQFEIWREELVCRVAALYVDGAVLLWLNGAGAAGLGDVALGVPSARGAGGGQAGAALAGPAPAGPAPPGPAPPGPALASTLLAAGADGAAEALARRLAVALRCPVYVCCGTVFDRWTMPVVERGVVAEITATMARANTTTLK